MGIEPCSRDPSGSGSKIDQLTAAARAFDRGHPSKGMKFVRALMEDCAPCRRPGARICEHDRSFQQRGITRAFKVRMIRLGAFIVLMQSHVTRLVYDRPPPAGSKLINHLPRRRGLRGGLSNLPLELNAFRAP